MPRKKSEESMMLEEFIDYGSSGIAGTYKRTTRVSARETLWG
jgi:hypothetical protein